MKKILKYFIVAAVLLGFIYLGIKIRKRTVRLAQENEKPVPPPRKYLDIYYDHRWTPYLNIAELTSLKYDIDSTLVLDFVIDYLKRYDNWKYRSIAENYVFYDSTAFKKFDDQPPMPLIVEYLSEEYNISKDTVGLMIYDISVWHILHYMRSHAYNPY